jgi:hypothetical protein
MDYLSGQSTSVSTQIQKSSSVFDKVLCFSLVLSASVCLVCYPWEFLGRPRERARWYSLPKPSQRNLRLSLWLPHVAWLVCGVLGTVQLFLEPSKPDSCGNPEQPNPDIVGMGVRVGLMSIMGLTALSVIAGACEYRGETGSKELGVASLASMYDIPATLWGRHTLNNPRFGSYSLQLGQVSWSRQWTQLP